MSRTGGNTVTQPLHGLSVLVPSENEADTWVVVSPDAKHERHCPVREVTSADIEGAGQLERIFSRKELPLILGAADLRRAIKKKDEPGFREAFEKIRPWLLDIGGEITLAKEIDWYGSREVYATLINRHAHGARLIFWQPEGKLLKPALWCPDLKTALFVVLIMGRLRVCPYCRSVFEGNTDYCKPSHGVNWRTAKSRAKKPQ